MQASLARAYAVEPRVNAVVDWVPDPALLSDAADRPLRGIPTFIKDNEALAGPPTRQGSGL